MLSAAHLVPNARAPSSQSSLQTSACVAILSTPQLQMSLLGSEADQEGNELTTSQEMLSVRTWSHLPVMDDADSEALSHEASLSQDAWVATSQEEEMVALGEITKWQAAVGRMHRRQQAHCPSVAPEAMAIRVDLDTHREVLADNSCTDADFAMSTVVVAPFNESGRHQRNLYYKYLPAQKMEGCQDEESQSEAV